MTELRDATFWDRTRIKVLVIEHHDGFRAGLAAILVQEGFAVDTAASGVAALERAVLFEPDVILMDVDMPRMSCVEATRRLRQVTDAARVVLLGYRDEGAMDAVAAGASGYLSKAARLNEVVAAVHGAAHGAWATWPRVSATPLIEDPVRAQLA